MHPLLIQGEALSILVYQAVEAMKQSDHRPVRALIEIKLENAIDDLITDQVVAVCTEVTVAVTVTVC
jgi:hypothetical protein